MKSIINIKKLIHDYQKYNEDGQVESTYRAVDEVSLDVQPGQFIAILGHNGSGKSTLAKHLNAILLPTEGSVYVDGKDTRDEEKIREIRQTAGMVFQNPDNQIIGTVVDEDVAFGPENMGVPSEEIEKRVEEGLKTVEMWEYRSHSPNKLSGGQKQRVAIAGVVAMHPKCIVLDEPTAMLDPVGRREVIRAARKLNKEEHVTIILITHYMEEAATADRVVVMSAGRVVMEGTPKEVFRNVEELRALHLDVPQAAELCHALTAAGCPMADDIIDVEECAAALYELLTGKKAPGAAQEKAEEVSACPQS